MTYPKLHIKILDLETNGQLPQLLYRINQQC